MTESHVSRRTFIDATRTGLKETEVGPSVEAYKHLHSEKEGGDVDARKKSYATMINHYYDLVTDFYEFGWGQSFHFGPRHRGEAFLESLRRHQHWLASQLDLREGMEVLDVGCGVGGPMRNIARFSGAKVTGINNNDYQIKRGTAQNRAAGLYHLCRLEKGDFMKMPFEDQRFDNAFAIEATCHAPDRRPVFSEIFRVLKPGGRFAGYEWCVTDAFDEKNQDHQRIRKGIETGNALPALTPTSVVDDALRAAGFEIEETLDRAPSSDPETPWYLPLTGRENDFRGIQRRPLGRAFIKNFVKTLERVKLAPQGSSEVSAVLNIAADALVEGGELGIMTPMYFFKARKPG